MVRLVKIGVVFPQTEIGPDVGAVRAYGQCAAELGYHHVLAYDHVVGADPAVHRGWKGPYDVRTQFHEPFVLFGFLAGITSLHLVTGILILPQRQTVLVAKQAAELDLLSGGRLRLGVGVGWNPVEYDALGQDFAVRGARLDEQCDLLRQLWTRPSVTWVRARSNNSACSRLPASHSFTDSRHQTNPTSPTQPLPTFPHLRVGRKAQTHSVEVSALCPLAPPLAQRVHAGDDDPDQTRSLHAHDVGTSAAEFDPVRRRRPVGAMELEGC